MLGAGDVYKGEWKFDSQSGHGEKSYANGEVYKGEWEMDLTHGARYCILCMYALVPMHGVLRLRSCER